MNSEPAVRGIQSEIIRVATDKLGRSLTEKETRFITSRGGFMALEAIHDTVQYETKEYIERYLNSE